MEFRFKEIRENYELKQLDVSNKINITRGGYANIECESANIKLRCLLKYCNELNVSMDYVCRLVDKNNISHIVLVNELDKHVIANRLNEFEKDMGLLAKNVAEELGIVKTTYSQYKSTKCACVIQTLMLKSICKKYGYSMDWFVGRSNKKMR